MPVFLFLRKMFFFKNLIFCELHLMSFLYVFPEIPLSGCHQGPFFSRTRKRQNWSKSVFSPFSNMHVTKKSPSQAGELYMGPSTLQLARKTCKNAGEMLFLFRKQCKIHGFGLFLSCPPSHMSAQTLHLLDLQLEVLVPSTRPFKECETEVVD